MKIFLLTMLYTLQHSVLVNSIGDRRQKRYLIFTPSTQWGVFATVSIPLHPETTVSMAWFFEANYYNVDNSTYFEPLLGDIATIQRKQKRSVHDYIITRKKIYTFIESTLEKHDYPGKNCLLRAICENADSHFLHNGVMGDLIHLLLTPSTSMSEVDIEDSYYEAEYLGLENDCQYYVPDCPHNPLDMFSIDYDKLTII